MEITPEVIASRRAYVEECRNLYYDTDWNATPNRSVCLITGACLYRSAIGNCAAGKLDPTGNWREHAPVDSILNSVIAIDAMKRLGYHSGDDKESIKWILSVQMLHDHPKKAKRIYGLLKEHESFESNPVEVVASE
jgi:hypothetical protein